MIRNRLYMANTIANFDEALINLRVIPYQPEVLFDSNCRRSYHVNKNLYKQIDYFIRLYIKTLKQDNKLYKTFEKEEA